MMMAMLVSALSLARERELGTFEQLLVTPLRPAEILVGKALPGIIVGWIDANIVIVAALLWFRVPFLGSMLVAAGDAAGLHVGRGRHRAGDFLDRPTQQQAMLGVFVIASPMVVLSGYAAPVDNMPATVELHWPSGPDPLDAGDYARTVPGATAAPAGAALRLAVGADRRRRIWRGLGCGA